MTGRKQQPRSLRSDAEEVRRHCTGWNVRLAARRITRFFDGELADTRLSIAQFGLMAEVAAASDDTLGALANRTGMEQSTLTRNLQALEREGLVEIAVVAGNQRRRMVWLTEAGATRLNDAMPVWRKAHEVLSTALDPELAPQLAAASESLELPPHRLARRVSQS